MLRRKTAKLLCSLVFIFGYTVASAETDLLNLSAYAEGTRVPYGENMVVVQDEETGEKWITETEGSMGRLNIPINLPSDSFEILIDIHGAWTGRTGGFFLVGDEVQFTFGMNGNARIWLESSYKDATVWQNKGKNSVRLVVNGGVAKIYVNDAFLLKPL